MASMLERRIEALEERERARNPRIVVVQQAEDGTWPPEPSGASLVVALCRQGILQGPDPLPEVA